MGHPFQGLEFISLDLKWTPKFTGDSKADYEYGRECAYRYSEALLKVVVSGGYPELMQMNEAFRASINIETSAGRGFQEGIIGR